MHGVHDDKVNPKIRLAAVKAVDGVDPGRAAQLQNASMQNAEAGYVALARAIRRAAPAAASVAPKFGLVWLSEPRGPRFLRAATGCFRSISLARAIAASASVALRAPSMLK